MQVITTEKGMFLETEHTTGNKAWTAKLVGTDPKFKFNREVLNSTRKGLKLDLIQEGDIIENVEFSHSGKSRNNYYYKVQDGKLISITEKDAILHFA